MFREGFLEEVTLGLILEGSVDVCQRSKVGVGAADRVATGRWGQHSIINDAQGVWEAGKRPGERSDTILKNLGFTL